MRGNTGWFANASGGGGGGTVTGTGTDNRVVLWDGTGVPQIKDSPFALTIGNDLVSVVNSNLGEAATRWGSVFLVDTLDYSTNLDVREGGTTRLFIENATGNIGAGTITPQEHLHVSGGGAQRIEVESLGASPTAFKATNTISSFGFFAETSTNGSGIFDYTAATVRLFVNGTTGNVAIGNTASPSEHLHIIGGGAQRIRLESTGGGAAALRQVTPVADFGWYSDNLVNEFNLRDYAAGVDRLTVTSSGELRQGVDGTFSAPAYSFVNDVDTGMYLQGVGILSLTAGGVRGLEVDDTGAALQVLHTIGNASAPGISFINDRDTGVYNPSANQLSFVTGGLDRIRVNTLGQMGIGTIAPSAKLDISVSGDGTRALYINTERGWAYEQEGTGATSALRFRNINGGNKDFFIDTDGDTTFRSQDGSTVQVSVDHANGRLGVGTVAPAFDIDIVKTTNTYLRSRTTNVNGIGAVALQNDAVRWDVEVNGGDGDRLRIRDITNGVAPFKIEPNSPTNSVYITPNGVGIGTVSPTAAIHLKAGVAAANGSPLKFTSGTLLTTPEAGSMNYDGKTLWFTPFSNRRNIILNGTVSTSTQTIANTTTETTFYTDNLAANALNVGKVIKVRAAGYYSTHNGSAAFALKLKIGGTIITTIVSNNAAVTNIPWEVEFLMTVRSIGGAGTVIGFARLESNNSVASVSATATTVVDTTTANNITLTAQWNQANPGATFSRTQAFTEING